MVRTTSAMVPLGQTAPDFALPDTDGKTVRRAHFEGQPLLVAFLCNHCPYVKHIQSALPKVAQAILDRGVAVVGINANDVENYPDDSPERMKEDKQRFGYPFAYLFDETQEVARAYDATCTPDFFLYDRDHRLAYRGQFDASRPDSGVPVTGEDLLAAVDAMLGGRTIEEQQPSLGCNIKWKAG